MKKKPQRYDGENTCFTDCVAYFFDMHPAHVPFFIGYTPFWFWYVKQFFKRRGYIIEAIPYKPGLMRNNRKLYIVSGLSPRSKSRKKNDFRTIHHAVIYKGGKLFYDPKVPHGKCIKGKPIWVYLAWKAKSRR